MNYTTQQDASLQDSAKDASSDEQLLLAYRQTGDRDIFSRLVRRYERELYSYLRRYLGDAEMAEDAFQAAFLQVHLKCGQFEPDRSFRPWLYTIATNQAIDAQRRNRRHRMVSLNSAGSSRQSQGEESGKLIDVMVSSEPDPFARADEIERREQIKQVIAALPEHLRLVVNLVYYQGLKYREAAEVLSVPVGTIKSRLHAAIARLVEVFPDA
jgi:RNA polymerase sigma-70 factor (ECF subfamily)